MMEHIQICRPVRKKQKPDYTIHEFNKIYNKTYHINRPIVALRPGKLSKTQGSFDNSVGHLQHFPRPRGYI